MNVPVIFNQQDGLLTIVSQDASGGPASIDASTLVAVSSNPDAFGDAVLDPPDQSQPGRVAFTMRTVCFHPAVGPTATFHVTAQSNGVEITGPDVTFEIVEGDSGGMPATNLVVSGTAVDKPV